MSGTSSAAGVAALELLNQASSASNSQPTTQQSTQQTTTAAATASSISESLAASAAASVAALDNANASRKRFGVPYSKTSCQNEGKNSQTNTNKNPTNN